MNVTIIFFHLPAILFTVKREYPTYFQALRINSICSNNEFFDKRCYNERMVRKKILRARAIPGDTVPGKVNNQKNNKKTTFNMAFIMLQRF